MFITCQRLKNCRYTINATRLNFFSLKKKHKSFHLRSIGKYEKKGLNVVYLPCLNASSVTTYFGIGQ